MVTVATNGQLFDKTMSNVKETKARGAVVFGITIPEYALRMAETVDCQFIVPETEPIPAAQPVRDPASVCFPLCLLLRGCDIDKPRNLAKFGLLIGIIINESRGRSISVPSWVFLKGYCYHGS